MATNERPEGNDLWAPFRYFLGSWTGTGTGKPGDSSVSRTYSLILAGQFLEIKGQSVFEPQESNPSGEVHEELSLVSYDRVRSRYVYREFLAEGYVNQYVLEPPAPGDTVLVFVTEAIENLPAGWRARTTLEILSPDHFRETFELAGPGKAWACFITSELHRAP
jgi:hypothetical protein